ncbi:MAG: ECF transporter S component [Chloroflexota bacterium]|jgi:energy-coupling factor transport system substrate-specific component
MSRILSAAIYIFSVLIGIATFAYPFVLPPAAQSVEQQTLVPLLTMVLLLLCLGVLLIEVQGQTINARMVAALGVLVSITAVLRFIETAIPAPGGFSPIFAPLILAGYVFGARFGFLMGVLALLVSALITGGVGPWLPYQMFTVGWVGLTAGWLPHLSRPRLELALLLLFGLVWGFLFGAIINLYSWPFLMGPEATSWQAGAGWGEGVTRYLAYYAATSLLWDSVRGAGNMALLLLLGTPAIRALTRFRERLEFQVVA